MTVDYAGLERAVPPSVLIALDASVTLAYLTGSEPVSPAAAWIFDGCISTGRNPAVISTLTATELLVRPFRAGDASSGTVEGFLRFFGALRLADVTYPIAREAARIRAVTGLAVPDAVVIATAIEHRADVVVTNDRRWPATVDAPAGTLRVMRLGAFVSDEPPGT
ncbi:MAG TPA: PIN domain-containing protein [Candidatus Sulfomarinibacteraceae bacterium]|nr:PIN domain-containing protein [Candidatus Sulfomarinibacteraceae bacterium]